MGDASGLNQRVPRGALFALALVLCSAGIPLPARAVDVSKLPLVEIPAAAPSDTFVIFVSGDGGWASIDKTMSKVLADNGFPVVGLNSLQYFWKKRTPDGAGADLGAIIDHYLASWKKSRVIVLGYSRGADVLPAMINRMPGDLLSRVRLIALLGPSQKVQFEFHLSDWLHESAAGMPVGPELARITAAPVLCLWGEDDKDSLCHGLSAPNVTVVTLKGAHHFEGGYENLARIVLQQLKK